MLKAFVEMDACQATYQPNMLVDAWQSSLLWQPSAGFKLVGSVVACLVLGNHPPLSASCCSVLTLSDFMQSTVVSAVLAVLLSPFMSALTAAGLGFPPSHVGALGLWIDGPFQADCSSHALVSLLHAPGHTNVILLSDCCCFQVLCASNDTHDAVDPVNPPEGVPVGERVMVAGFEQPPLAEVNPKKKILEKLFPDLKTDAQGVATYKSVAFATSRGPVTSSIPNAWVK